MKKILQLAFAAAAALVFAGCGGPKIPADTVAAAYIDLDALVDNLEDVVEDAIDEVPDKAQRKEFEKQFEDFVKEHKKDVKALDAEWAAVTVGASAVHPEAEIAVVVKCDCKEKIPSAGASLKEMLDGMGKEEDSKKGCTIYSGGFARELGLRYTAIVDDKYVIATSSKRRMETMVDLYLDGKGEESDDFDDLTDIGGDTVARAMTAKAETIIGLFGGKETKKEIEKFFKDLGDEDLGDMLLDFGNVTLDVNFSDDIAGFELSVDAGCRELAKVVESVFTLARFGSRLGVDAASGVSYMVGRFIGQKNAEEVAKGAKAVVEQVRDAVEVDRSGSVATLTVEFDTDDLLEELVPALMGK